MAGGPEACAGSPSERGQRYFQALLPPTSQQICVRARLQPCRKTPAPPHPPFRRSLPAGRRATRFFSSARPSVVASKNISGDVRRLDPTNEGFIPRNEGVEEEDRRPIPRFLRDESLFAL